MGPGDYVDAIYGLLSTAGVDGRFAQLNRSRMSKLQNAPVVRHLLDRINDPVVRAALDRLVLELQAKHSTVYEMLKRLDHNKDGVLNREEIRRGLADMDVRLSSTELDSVMRAFDKDGNGTIDYTEFFTALTNAGGENVGVDKLDRKQFDNGATQGSVASRESDLTAIQLTVMGASDDEPIGSPSTIHEMTRPPHEITPRTPPTF